MSVLSLLSQDKRRDLLRKESLETVYSSNSRLSLLQRRKKLSPLHVEMSSQTLSSKAADKYVTQRVLSAKTHRVKQLQNQLADAHYHLQELSNENRVLRALQKKHEIALQRYENSNAELPQVLNSHNEEMRVQQTRYKQLKLQFKDVSQKLKERELQLQQLRDEHLHLLELSKDRNLPEREKLQAQVSELSLRVQQQNDTISTLQRRIALEAKNFRHQLQNEINKHKDTRHDLDLAITNADKLSTIIEMKEKMLSTVASRVAKSPPKTSATVGNRPISKMTKLVSEHTSSVFDERASGDQNLGRYCENSRSLSSALSHDEDTSSSLEPKSRYVRNRLNSSSTSKSTPAQTRKSSKGSEELIEIAKTVQDGMAELSIFNEEIDLTNPIDKESQKKIEMMKQELLKKIQNDEDPAQPRKHSGLRKTPTEDTIEETINEVAEIERPKSRGRQTSFYDETSVEDNVTTVALNNYKACDELKPKRENSSLQKSTSSKPIDKYCNDIIQDIEKSSKVIDRHIKEFSDSKFESDKLVQQLQAVDKINEYVNAKGEIPEEAFEELNNNFKMLTDQVLSESVIPIARKRSISGRRPSRVESRTNLFGDASMSNQDLLEDLLGKK